MSVGGGGGAAAPAAAGGAPAAAPAAEEGRLSNYIIYTSNYLSKFTILDMFCSFMLASYFL